MPIKHPLPLAALSALSLALCAPARAWFPPGHSIIAAAAVRALPAEMPQWFREGTGQVAHDAQDPDVQKSRDLPFMTDVEYPQHFLDWELLRGRPLPASRAEFYKLCAELKVDPADVGEVPYAVAQWTQRLTMTFAEARRYPNNPYIHNKALVQAGILSHYSGDVCQPLHVTVDHDGRANPDGSSPKTGIHAKVDGLVENLHLKPEELAQNQTVQAFPALFPAIEATMKASHDQVNRVYELEAQLPSSKGEGAITPAVRDFTVERARAATNFTASLFLTAWRDSAKIKLPAWLNREETTN